MIFLSLDQNWLAFNFNTFAAYQKITFLPEKDIQRRRCKYLRQQNTLNSKTFQITLSGVFNLVCISLQFSVEIPINPIPRCYARESNCLWSVPPYPLIPLVSLPPISTHTTGNICRVPHIPWSPHPSAHNHTQYIEVLSSQSPTTPLSHLSPHTHM